MRKRVLFLCTGNAVRSQMAEGWARHLHSGWLDAYSAGTEPKGLDPRAVQVMREAGVDISSQASKGVVEFAGQEFDLVVTVCDCAKEACPYLPAKANIHHSFDDPSQISGDDEEVLDAFRRCRDEIREFVEGLAEFFED
jgi:arsenate reductase (thioredoxin)